MTAHSNRAWAGPARHLNAAVPAGLTGREPAQTAFITVAMIATAVLLAGCGGSTASLSTAGGTAETSTATPSATALPIANTACAPVDGQRASDGDTYVCTRDETGTLVWLEESAARSLTTKLVAAAASKAAAEKAAADKAAADKAGAEKAAAERAAAEKGAADKAAAEQAASEQAAAEKAAAQAQAARDAAAAQAAAAAAVPPQRAAPAAPAAASGCDPNYSGCVPIASDVDCAGGSGNGPAYVQGPVSVIGSDIYGLDRDGDGFGCES
ncbi:hypothetical protein [Pseudarthrobacter sp. MEB009]|uniref:hypothetical protein n=1 Tax=Pseudarthrobacter sp. MEB009 TaxID=3040326 RepID=UPI0025556068|nr:hypothetical protein [Pseudarthrobacter sp. MEB009]